jgi:cytochrome c oxidase subunit 2
MLLLMLFGLLAAAYERGPVRAAGATLSDIVAVQEGPSAQTFTINARKYSFSPARLEVAQGDLVKVTLVTEDIPHSFTVDAYRIAKRAAPHQSVTFEFRADQPGSFPFYCNLEIDSGCRAMKGELIVRKK